MRYLIMQLILMPMLLSDSFNFYDDEGLSYDPKRERLLRNIPMYIKRSYKEYSSKSNCIDRVLRSTPASVKPQNSPWFVYKVRLPRRIGQVIEAYLLLEFYKVSNIDRVGSYNYSIEVQHMNGEHSKQNFNASEVIIHKNMIELFFNVTNHYRSAKILGEKKLKLRFRFPSVDLIKNQTKEKTSASSEFIFKILKPFFITHEYNANCSLFLNQVNYHSRQFLKMAKRRSMLRTMRTQNSYPVDNNPRHPCHLTDWYVSFHSIGWSSFVIAPSGINARACSGVCKFPLVVTSSQHALLQTAVSASKGKQTSVCCVPIETEASTLVLSDDLNGSVYVIKYPNLIAKTCGCL